MGNKYLVLTGNEFGLDMSDTKFLNTSEAEDKYNEYIEEYGCASMYQVLGNKLELIKQENDF